MLKFKFIKGDIFGGLTAGIVALPLALAFGIQSGLGAIAGLYGAIILGFFASLLGGTPTQVSGPTGPMTVVSSATIATFLVFANGDVTQVTGSIVACFVLAGILQIVMGVLKVGSFIKFIPYPVISGFMSGIGVIIILLQLFPAFGATSPKNTIAVIQNVPDLFKHFNTYAILFTALTILIIYTFPYITKKVPSTLVALISVTLLSVYLKKDVPIIGAIPEGLPPFHFKELFSIHTELIGHIITGAITLAALGAIDSLLTSVVADNVTKTKHDSNRELIGQGIGNTIGGMFTALPGAGATMRTLVNIRSGGRNRLSGMLHSVVLLIIVLGVGKYAALIPKSVLAGILITVGLGILDYKGFKHIRKIPTSDAVIMVVVLLVTVFLDLLSAVGIGMVLAAVLFMKKMSEVVEQKSDVNQLTSYKEEMQWTDEHVPSELLDKVIVKRLDGPLFFGFASEFQNLLKNIGNIKYVILRMKKVPFIDQTGLYALEESILLLESKGIEVVITGLQDQPKALLENINAIPYLIEPQHLFDTFQESVDYIVNHYQEKN
jgi:SulP family sulfate permease